MSRHTPPPHPQQAQPQASSSSSFPSSSSISENASQTNIIEIALPATTSATITSNSNVSAVGVHPQTASVGFLTMYGNQNNHERQDDNGTGNHDRDEMLDVVGDEDGNEDAFHNRNRDGGLEENGNEVANDANGGTGADHGTSSLSGGPLVEPAANTLTAAVAPRVNFDLDSPHHSESDVSPEDDHYYNPNHYPPDEPRPLGRVIGAEATSSSSGSEARVEENPTPRERAPGTTRSRERRNVDASRAARGTIRDASQPQRDAGEEVPGMESTTLFSSSAASGLNGRGSTNSGLESQDTRPHGLVTDLSPPLPRPQTGRGSGSASASASAGANASGLATTSIGRRPPRVSAGIVRDHNNDGNDVSHSNGNGTVNGSGGGSRSNSNGRGRTGTFRTQITSEPEQIQLDAVGVIGSGLGRDIDTERYRNRQRNNVPDIMSSLARDARLFHSNRIENSSVNASTSGSGSSSGISRRYPEPLPSSSPQTASILERSQAILSGRGARGSRLRGLNPISTGSGDGTRRYDPGSDQEHENEPNHEGDGEREQGDWRQGLRPLFTSSAWTMARTAAENAMRDSSMPDDDGGINLRMISNLTGTQTGSGSGPIGSSAASASASNSAPEAPGHRWLVELPARRDREEREAARERHPMVSIDDGEGSDGAQRRRNNTDFLALPRPMFLNRPVSADRERVRERDSILPPLPEGDGSDPTDIEMQNIEDDEDEFDFEADFNGQAQVVRSDAARRNRNRRLSRYLDVEAVWGEGEDNEDEEGDLGEEDMMALWEGTFVGHRHIPRILAHLAHLEAVDDDDAEEEDDEDDEEDEDNSVSDDDEEEEEDDDDEDEHLLELAMTSQGYAQRVAARRNRPRHYRDSYPAFMGESDDMQAPSYVSLQTLTAQLRERFPEASDLAAYIAHIQERRRRRSNGGLRASRAAMPIPASDATRRARDVAANAAQSTLARATLPLSRAMSTGSTNRESNRIYQPAVVATAAETVTSEFRYRDVDNQMHRTGAPDGSIASLPTSLSRQKSIKRRRVETDPSQASSSQSLLGNIKDPLPASALPEYMQLSRLPIPFIPTRFNLPDSSTRLAVSSGAGKNGEWQPGVVVTFIGTGERGDADAAAVRTDWPIPTSGGMFYFEVEILSKGVDGYISLGFMMRWSNLSRLVGWDPGSFGWHTDDGFVFESRGEGTNRGWPTSTVGDIVGCGIDMTTGIAFFTQNGKFVGQAFSDLQNKENLYPAVGMMTPGERVQINLKGPFKYDILSHTMDARERALVHLSETPLTYSLEKPALDKWVEQMIDVEKGEMAAKARQAIEDESATNPIIRTSSLRQRRRDMEQQVLARAEKTIRKTGVPCLLPRKSVDNADTALAPAVMQYLIHNGFFKSSAALAEAIDSRQKNLKRSGGTVEVDGTLSSTVDVDDLDVQMIEARDLYAAGKYRETFIHISRHQPQLLKDCQDWTALILLGWFYGLLRQGTAENTLSEDDMDVDSVPENLADPEDLEFATQEFGIDSHSVISVLDLAIIVGRKIHERYAKGTSAIVQRKITNALSMLAYDSIDDAPGELKRDTLAETSRSDADRMLADMRGENCFLLLCVNLLPRQKWPYRLTFSKSLVLLAHSHRPTTSKLEDAVMQTAQTLKFLGSEHGIGEAAYLPIPGLASEKR